MKAVVTRVKSAAVTIEGKISVPVRISMDDSKGGVYLLIYT